MMQKLLIITRSTGCLFVICNLAQQKLANFILKKPRNTVNIVNQTEIDLALNPSQFAEQLTNSFISQLYKTRKKIFKILQQRRAFDWFNDKRLVSKETTHLTDKS